ncbi:MAG: hypothetical protein V3T40_04395 [Nitrososphaerales archaeon]
MCHSFFERMRKKYDIKIEGSKENQELVNSFIGGVSEEAAEKLLQRMCDEEIYKIYVNLFKRKKDKDQVQAYA